MSLSAPLPVISASKRTDIPAFYLRWLIERLDAGYVDVPNPFFRNAARPPTQRVSLLPEAVGWIVFWSKNYGVFLRHTARFAPYRLYFQFTINPASALLEPDVPGEAVALRQAEALARRYGGERIAWRYDPLVFWWQGGTAYSNCDPAFFARMCAALAPLGVRRCFISIADHYRDFRRRVAAQRPDMTLLDPPAEQITAIGRELHAIAAAHGIALVSCAEPAFAAAGIGRGACVDGALLNALARSEVADAAPTRVSLARASDQAAPGREACGCTRMIDIGSYRQQCGYACLYCYASPGDRQQATGRETRGEDRCGPPAGAESGAARPG